MTRTKKNDTTSRRVRRGGSWFVSDPAWVRAALRYTIAPAYRLDSLGFRCALRGREPR